MVTAEGFHQHRHSRVTDGIALEAAGKRQGTVDVTVLGPGESRLTQLEPCPWVQQGAGDLRAALLIPLSSPIATF